MEFFSILIGLPPTDMLAKLKSIAVEVVNLSLGVRLTIGVLLGAIGSSSLIGFVSEYAAVNYALAYGVRLPTEGLPYLRYAAAGVTFLLFMLALGTFFGIYWLLRFLLRVALNASRSENTSELSLRKYLVVFGPGAVIATQPLMGSLTIAVDKFRLPEYTALTIVGIVIVLLLVFGRRPQWLSWFTLVTYVAGTAAIVVALFTPRLYGEMLNFIRFGGGVPIEITRNCKDITPCTSISRGNLFLRTQDYFFLVSATDKQITEIPSSSVIEYKYLGSNRWAGQ